MYKYILFTALDLFDRFIFRFKFYIKAYDDKIQYIEIKLVGNTLTLTLTLTFPLAVLLNYRK